MSRPADPPEGDSGRDHRDATAVGHGDTPRAVGVLTVPATVRPPPADAPLDWRRGEIAFEREAPGAGD